MIRYDPEAQVLVASNGTYRGFAYNVDSVVVVPTPQELDAEPVPAGQLDVEQHEPRGGLLREQRRDEPVTGVQPHHPVSLQRQQGRDQLQIVGLVLDHDDRRHQAPPGSARGSVNQNVLPWPSALSTPMAPPCSSTSRLESASPSPVPS